MYPIISYIGNLLCIKKLFSETCIPLLVILEIYFILQII